MEYWCHICKRETDISPQNNCLHCQKNFVEQVELQEQHPRHFVPYNVNSRNRMVTELVFMSSHRPFRAVNPQSDIDQSFDALIHQLMQNDPNRYGPPPASKDSLSTLSEIQITNTLISQRGTMHQGVDEFGSQIDSAGLIVECSVCKEELNEGDLAVDMPCGHLFHKVCILSWLEAHNNCPICRFEMPTDDMDYEARRMRK